MQTLHIATACLRNDRQELLVVRKQNSRIWMLPGGKIDGQETALQALLRELNEELQITLAATDLQSLGTFESPAANEADTMVHAQVFMARLPGNQHPAIAAEIAAMKWLAIDQPLPDDCAALMRNCVVPALRAQCSL